MSVANCNKGLWATEAELLWDAVLSCSLCISSCFLNLDFSLNRFSQIEHTCGRILSWVLCGKKINRLASELLTYFVSIEFRESNECFGTVGMSTFVREFSSVYFEMNVEIRLRAVRFMTSWFCTIESLSVRIVCSLMFLQISSIQYTHTFHQYNILLYSSSNRYGERNTDEANMWERHMKNEYNEINSNCYVWMWLSWMRYWNMSYGCKW
jgi:hypothetical protein